MEVLNFSYKKNFDDESSNKNWEDSKLDVEDLSEMVCKTITLGPGARTCENFARRWIRWKWHGKRPDKNEKRLKAAEKLLFHMNDMDLIWEHPRSCWFEMVSRCWNLKLQATGFWDPQNEGPQKVRPGIYRQKWLDLFQWTKSRYIANSLANMFHSSRNFQTFLMGLRSCLRACCCSWRRLRNASARACSSCRERIPSSTSWLSWGKRTWAKWPQSSACRMAGRPPA